MAEQACIGRFDTPMHTSIFNATTVFAVIFVPFQLGLACQKEISRRRRLYQLTVNLLSFSLCYIIICMPRWRHGKYQEMDSWVNIACYYLLLFSILPFACCLILSTVRECCLMEYIPLRLVNASFCLAVVIGEQCPVLAALMVQVLYIGHGPYTTAGSEAESALEVFSILLACIDIMVQIICKCRDKEGISTGNQSSTEDQC